MPCLMRLSDEPYGCSRDVCLAGSDCWGCSCRSCRRWRWPCWRREPGEEGACCRGWRCRCGWLCECWSLLAAPPFCERDLCEKDPTCGCGCWSCTRFGTGATHENRAQPSGTSCCCCCSSEGGGGREGSGGAPSSTPPAPPPRPHPSAPQPLPSFCR